MAGGGKGNYMPQCPCGKILTDMRNPDEQLRWAERLDVSWGFRDNGTAYRFNCQACHQKKWGRYSRPASKHLDIYLPGASYGACRLVCGDYFYLTSAAAPFP